MIETIDPEVYGGFEAEARERFRGRDEQDWPLVATALAVECAVWTGDADLLATGIPVWTTIGVEILLKTRISRAEYE